MSGASSACRLVIRPAAGALAAAALALGVGACGDDEDGSTTTEAAAAASVAVTTGDTADGFSWEVSPTPTAETGTVEFTNDSEELHVLIFARISEGFTFEEAFELEGKKGSATEVGQPLEAPPGQSATLDVTKPLEPGEYVLFCPLTQKKIPHYELGQLEEFSIE